MKNYFALKWKHKPEIASAFAENDNQVAHKLIPELEGKNSMPFDLELKKVTEEKDGLIISDNLTGLSETWVDYQPNSLAWPLMSAKMKSIIENNLTGNEGIEWVKANIKTSREQKIYYIPRFTKKLDVLNIRTTRYIAGTDEILKSCFSLSKVINYNIFHDELSYDLWKITRNLYVSEVLKMAIQKAQLTGVMFEKALVAE